MKELSNLTLASNLFVIENEIEKLEDRKKELREALMYQLQKQGVRAVRMENGIQYIRSQRDSLKVANESKAWAWGMENPEARMKIDTNAALKAFKGTKLPKYFKKTTTEFLTIKRPNEKKHVD